MGVIGSICLSLGIVLGLLAASIKSNVADPNPTLQSSYLREADGRISERLINGFSTENIGNHIAHLASKVHRAGTPEGSDVAEYIRRHFVSLGFDEIETPKYDVLLSYPDLEHPDTVHYVNGSTRTVISTGISGLRTDEERRSSMAGIRFSAYSKAGNLSLTRIVYANYGRKEDFEYLKGARVHIDSDTVVLARYGETFRGGIVRNSQYAGAGALLIYTDPMDFSNGSTDQTLAYPHTVHMPDDGTQRGSIAFATNGDPLTPLLPAKDYTARRTIEDAIEARTLPNLTVTPISYGDALKLFDLMPGPVAPKRFTGSLGVTYRLGGKLKHGSINVQVNTALARRTITNVVATIRGAIEPDRVILVGNHHDAWTYGAVDPNSGTAAMLEMATVLSRTMKETGWRPRRSIAFHAWDGEEYRLIGSTEWVQENLLSLQKRAVAYINADAIVHGNQTFKLRSVPMLENVAINATMKVPNPSEPEKAEGVKTIYDTWLRSSNAEEPRINLMASGSDFQSFLDYAGIACADIAYAYENDVHYPLYHTVHETPNLIGNIMDVGYKFTAASGAVWAEMTRDLADSLVLPLDVIQYGRRMQEYVGQLQDDPAVKGKDYMIDFLKQASDEFNQAANDFYGYIQSAVSKRSEMSLRHINDVLQALEQAFIQPGGLPGTPHRRHTIFAPSSTDVYTPATFAGIREAINSGQSYYAVKQQVSWVVYGLKQAIILLIRRI